MTLRTFGPLVAAALLIGPLAAPSVAESTGSAHQATEKIPEPPLVEPPPGFQEACQRYAWLCTSRSVDGEGRTADELIELARDVNRQVNLTVSDITDRENYGRADYWTLPGWRGGDCEDFVLEKYKRLLDAGVRGRDLSVAVVRHRGQNHAVLVLHHESGDLVLDSLKSRILLWNETDYRYLAMQTREDQSAWEIVAHQPRDSMVLAQH